jgi:hypothetical protein
MRVRLMSVILIVCTFAGFTVTGQALPPAEATSEPQPTFTPTPNLTVTAVMEMLRPTLESELSQRHFFHATEVARYSLFDYHIVYLLPQTTDEYYTFILPIAEQKHSMLSIRDISEVTGAVIAHTWRDVLDFDAEQPLQALFIHNDAEALIDGAWLRDTYQNRGIVIIGFNTRDEWLSRMLNVDEPRPLPVEGDSFHIYNGTINRCTGEHQDGGLGIQWSLNSYDDLFNFTSTLRLELHSTYYGWCR